MRKIILAEGEKFSASQIKRTGAFNVDALKIATDIISDVQKRGDDCLRELTEKFDGVSVENFRVSADVIDAGAKKCNANTVSALKHAASQIRDFHERQVQQSWFYARDNGAIVGSKISPVESAGIYVPGGRALYPSSFLMNAIPASVAGVPRIVCVTPPAADGTLDPALCVACKITGVSEVYTVGGAQAIAALAYGTEQIKPVVKITGPGNAFVAAAKKIVNGDVGIDMIAGPSEVCVVADTDADARLVAIDLMAQAEHDPLAACYLVCTNEHYACDVEREIEEHLKNSTRAEITKKSLDNQGLCIVVPNIDAAIQVVDVIAPEHLELHIENAQDVLGSVRNAGAIFLGKWAVEALGDYCAGPNHTLPTGGTARFSSPLSVDDFIKKSSVIQYSSKALLDDAKATITIAEHEGLWAHAQSVRLRADALRNETLGEEAQGGGALGENTLGKEALEENALENAALKDAQNE